MACTRRGRPDRLRSSQRAGPASILLFNGTGTSRNDVAAVEAILAAGHLDYATATSSQLNRMSESSLRDYRLLIVPGGNFVDIGNGLTSSTTGNVRRAVESGLNYLGLCAGGFFAGNLPYNGLNLTSGVRFPFYAAENRGVRKASPALDQYWEDGPQFTGGGEVVGRYPDGTPAIVQGTYGTGLVTLSGIHPEAPDSWRRGLIFHTPAGADHAYAEMLIRAACDRVTLPHF